MSHTAFPSKANEKAVMPFKPSDTPITKTEVEVSICEKNAYSLRETKDK
jgi:hypothetical protein